MKNAPLLVGWLTSRLLTATSLLAQVSPIVPVQPVTAQAGDTLTQPKSRTPGAGRVLGVVLDSTTHQPVSFATVAAFDSLRNTLAGGTTADEQGRFVITGLTTGAYYFRISLVGYQTRQIPLRIPPQQPEVRLGRVWLRAETRTLQEVRVVAQQVLVEEKEDRLVYNAQKDVSGSGGSATDILRKVPMVTVDLDGNLSLRGSSNVRVLINNKPSALASGSVADALRQLPADQIKSIEVMTSPSAKYDAEGSAGIINIVLKNDTLRGFSLGLDGGLGNRGGSLGINGGLRTGRMAFSLAGSGWLNYNINGAFANVQTTGPTVTRQRADTRSHAQSGHYTFGWDYDLNRHNALATSVRFGLRNNYATQERLTTESLNTSQLLPYLDVRNVVTRDLSRSVDVNTVYTHVFKPGREVSLLALFNRNDRANQFTADQLSLTDPVRVLARNRNENPGRNEETTFQADYQTTPGRGASPTGRLLEAGVKVIFRRVTSDYAYGRAAGGSGNFVVDSLRAPNGLRYDQDVLAGYGSYTLPLPEHVTLKVGVRYEHTTVQARYQNVTTTPDGASLPLGPVGYGNWLPSLALSKGLKGGKLVKLAYNRRLQRPGIQFLNPNLNFANPLNVVQGNPRVGPERTHNVELSLGTPIKTVYVHAAGFARFTNEAIQPLRDTVSTTVAATAGSERTGVIRTSYQNIGQERTYGLNLTGNGTLFSTWQLGSGLDIYHVSLTSPNPIYSRNAGWVLAGRFFSSVSLGRRWSVQGFGLLLARQVQLQGYQGGFTFYMLGIKKELADQRGSLGLATENFLNHPFKVRTELTSSQFTQHTVTSYYNAGVRLTFAYRLSRQSHPSANPTRKAIHNDDVKGGVERIDKQ